MTSSLHVIIGAGPVGSTLAKQLADSGERVRLLTRSGRGPVHPSIERRAVDASDSAALRADADGASVLYNCANPGSYVQWRREWPPLAASILDAAEGTGAVLATMSDLYGYGRVDGPMTRNTPLRPVDHKGEIRKRMWEDALRAHEAGRVRVTEARASDYIGPNLTAAGSVLARYAGATLTGRRASVFADPDQPHSWTAVEDVATTLATIGTDSRAWGSAWIVPSNPPRTTRAALEDLARAVGAPAPRLLRIPRWLLRAAGTFIPLLRELTGVLYQFDAPFVVDGSDTTAVFGIAATPWEEIIPATAEAWRRQARGTGSASRDNG